jgi:hypothetical protein
MFDAKSFFTMLIFVSMLFVAYNVLLVLRANAQFNDIITFQETRAAAIAKFGEPVDVYGCPPPDASPSADTNPFCKSNAVEIAYFRTCMIPPICPDLITLVFDKSGEVIYKYKPPKTTML